MSFARCHLRMETAVGEMVTALPVERRRTDNQISYRVDTERRRRSFFSGARIFESVRGDGVVAEFNLPKRNDP